MSIIVLVGAQWGDEGKGKITDYLAEKAKIVARYQGGNNAGHTVVINKKKIFLHLLPSGVLHEDTISIIGGGLVVDPEALIQEIKDIENLGYSVRQRLFIDYKAHIVFPYHKILDKLREESAKRGKIGTTGKGIGPAYEDKYSRKGLRMGDMLDENYFLEKLKETTKEKNLILEKIYNHPPMDIEQLIDTFKEYREHLVPYIKDTSSILYDVLRNKDIVLMEGAQGIMLDIDHGTYPYVTSSNPVTGGVSIGCGIPVKFIEKTIGVTKAYTTRVGEGPFPTELKDKLGNTLREKGGEYGVTTGRPRRCGWLDLVALKYAVRISGIDTLALTKLDVLSGFDTVKVAVGYKIDGKEVEEFPYNTNILSKVKPIYKEFLGWEAFPSSIEDRKRLPTDAQKYIEFIENYLEIPIEIISIGPGREETIY